MGVYFIPSKKNKKRGTWFIDYYDLDKKRQRVRGGSTKEEAQNVLDTINRQLRKKVHVPRSQAPVFEEAGEQWLDNQIRGQLSLGAVKAYESHFNNHLKPYFEKRGIKLDDINFSHIEEFRNYCLTREKPLSRTMANKLVGTLGLIFQYGMKKGWASHNPVKDVDKLKRPPHKKGGLEETVTEDMVLSPKEIRAFLNNTPERYKALFTTAVLTGIRQGELLALRWSDIDWVKNQICVRRNLCRYRDEGKVVFNPPKTKAGNRRIDMAPELVNTLKDWRTMQQLDRAEMSEKNRVQAEEYNLIFPSPTGNPESHGNMLRRGFHPALKASGIKRIGFHWLRHTYASLLIHMNEPLAYIAEQMGHASPEVTLRVYTHLIKSNKEGSASRLGATVFTKEMEEKICPSFDHKP